MQETASDHSTRRRVLFALNLLVRVAIVYWLAEAWILRDDPRFAGKAIPERNAVIVGSLSLLLPAIWILQRRPFHTYPFGLDIVYLSVFALDMAGNSFDLYERVDYFDLIPHFYSTGAFSLVAAVWWARTRHPDALARPARQWLPETTLVAAGTGTLIHVALEVQEYYTDVLAGTINVGGVADTVNDLAVGLLASLIFPPLAVRWFLGRPRIGWLGAMIVLVMLALAAVVMLQPGPRIADAIADRFATDPPPPLAAETRTALLAAARSRAAARLPAQQPPRQHAHDSATTEALRTALAGDYRSIEGDVGLDGLTALMRHDVRDPVDMTFRDWLEVVATARFDVVKVDVKRDRIGPIAEELERAVADHGLDPCTLRLNADVLEGPGAYADFTLGERVYTRIALKLEPDDLVELAERFPCATASIGAVTGPTPDGARYTAEDIEAFLDVAKRLRGAGAEAIVVAARWDLLSDEFVEAMATAQVRIDVWNSTTVRSPTRPAEEAAALQARYGDALDIIDLRR